MYFSEILLGYLEHFSTILDLLNGQTLRLIGDLCLGLAHKNLPSAGSINTAPTLTSQTNKLNCLQSSFLKYPSGAVCCTQVPEDSANIMLIFKQKIENK